MWVPKKSHIHPFVETNAVEEEFIGADVTNRQDCDTLVDSQAVTTSMGVVASAPSPSDPVSLIMHGGTRN